MQTHDLHRTATDGFAPGLRVGFPFHSGTGTASTAAVLIDLEPGGEVPRHTDSAEEILLVLEGEVEASAGEDSGSLRTGELAIVPALVPHSLRNEGPERALVLGFFSSATVVSVFDAADVGEEAVNVIGTPSTLAV